MTKKIGIIGFGACGCDLGPQHDFETHLWSLGLDWYQWEEKVKADALDFCDTVANTGYSVHITVNDYAALKDADVVVSTLGNIELQANNTDDRFAELPFTSKQVVQVARDLKASGFSGVLLVVTNPVDAVTQLYQQYTGLPKSRWLGQGPYWIQLGWSVQSLIVCRFLLLVYRVTTSVSMEILNLSLWSQVRVKGTCYYRSLLSRRAWCYQLRVLARWPHGFLWQILY